MDFLFHDVSERDMDLLILEELVSSKEVAKLFLSRVGMEAAEPVFAEISQTTVEWGESDIVVVFAAENKKHAFLIEDKIDAIAMPRQCDRYFKRGDNGVRMGEYDNYSVFIVAPERYLLENEEAKKYPNCVSYEEIAACLKGESSHSQRLKYSLICTAIEKQKHGYQVKEDKNVTAFWDAYISCAEDKYGELELLSKRGPKGTRARWPQYKTVIPKVSIYHKSLEGFVELTFDGIAASVGELEARMLSSGVLSQGLFATVTTAGNAAVVRIRVPCVDFSSSFEVCREDVEICFEAVLKLTHMAKEITKHPEIVEIVKGI